jgi:hypothetical protein
MDTPTSKGPAELDWAREEFGDAALGNRLRTERLVAMAGRVAEKPAGKVTEVFSTSAEREGAYRWLENKNFDETDVGGAAHRSCVRRSKGLPFVFVPMDGCTVSVADSTGGKGFGTVGTSETKGRGAEVMNAMAVTPDGVPLGVVEQLWWTRHRPAPRDGRRRALKDKETRYWLKCIEGVESAFAAEAVDVPRWYQLDAGADFRELLVWAVRSEQHITVRAAQNRRLAEGDQLLWDAVAAETTLGEFELRIPRGRKRKARVAVLELRSRRVLLKLTADSGDVELGAVLVQEVGTTPADEEPISWLLLTNMDVKTFEEARLVVYGYSQRWRVEEFHKAWKSVTKVEESQLEVTAFKPWATILASVAMRVERLKYLARHEPEQPATAELSAAEIQAIVALKGKDVPKDYRPGHTPTIAQAVRWIAELGGYTGAKSSGGPPGTIVIARGLQNVQIAALALTNVAARQA